MRIKILLGDKHEWLREYNPRRIIGYLLVILLFTLPGFALNIDSLQSTMAKRYGDDGSNLLNAWIRMLDGHAQDNARDKIKAVNQFFNRHINFTNDLILWKKKDYWATPIETMGIRSGDCEDFTIAKYMSLIGMGIPPEKLRLIYVRAKINGSGTAQAHMVLGYYQSPNATPLILDNLDPVIKPASMRGDLKPIYSFNRKGLWVGNISESQANPTSRLSPWRDVLQRMQEEGF